MNRPLFLVIAPLVATVAQLPRCDLPVVDFPFPCFVDADCDDRNACTLDTCVSGQCRHGGEASACDDGLYCNGNEHCTDGTCAPGQPPCSEGLIGCAAAECDEQADACLLPCVSNADCDDSLFCNGAEECSGCECVRGPRPCSSVESALQTCEEDADTCRFVECGRYGNCDDGIFCNGLEYCYGNLCFPGPLPCQTEGLTCDEQRGQCIGEQACDLDADCDDGLECTGSEYCVQNRCWSYPVPLRISEPSTGQLPGCFPCATDSACDTGLACDTTTGRCVPLDLLCVAQCSESVLFCCSVDNPQCAPHDPSGLDDFAATLSQWRESMSCRYPDPGSLAVAARCVDGTLVLHRADSRGPYGPLYTTYYHPDDLQLLAMTTIYGGGIIDYRCAGRVDWPSPYECRSPIVTEVICGERFAVGDELILDPCVSPCELAAGYCPYPTIDEYPNYDTTLTEWRNPAICEYYYPETYYWRLAGRCADGTLLVSDNNGLTSETRYFDPVTRAFLSLVTTTDVLDEVCLARGYWPFRFSCEGAVVTEVICQTTYAPGDSIPLP